MEKLRDLSTAGVPENYLQFVEGSADISKDIINTTLSGNLKIIQQLFLIIIEFLFMKVMGVVQRLQDQDKLAFIF